MLRRAILIVTGTAAAVTSALVYNPPQLAQVATSSKPTTPVPIDSTPPTGNATPAPKATKSSAPTTPSNLPSGNFAGDKVSTRWGPVQVEITVKNGVITSANALAYPDGDRRSLSISQQAIPYLIEQTLGVVKSSEVMGVSGASYTSNGWRTSLQSAIKKAGI
ncbi:MAG: FMN-binding protein [Actinobacteria bacterium]|jgi:uncharacterized protein with FMN-binding domain|nr:FMN-binding protein [Actinomycetota bacterium]NDI25187.1 FMN-binding protein [Actinomycetota bacterium]